MTERKPYEKPKVTSINIKEVCNLVGDPQAELDGLRAEVKRLKESWHCYCCDQTFTEPEAFKHFGIPHDYDVPACTDAVERIQRTLKIVNPLPLRGHPMREKMLAIRDSLLGVDQ